jgi:hypothetical protein
MRIDDRNLNGAAGPQSGRTQETHAPGSTESVSGAQSPGSGGGDRAELSSLTGRISQALQSHFAQRAERVAKLAQEFNTGRLSADSRSTSRAVVQDAIERKDGTR